MAFGSDQLIALLGSLGPVGTGLAVAAVPIAVGVTAYVTRMGSQAKIDRLEAELVRLERTRSDDVTKLQHELDDLNERYNEMRKSGALIRVQLDAIVADAAAIAEHIDAAEYSVLVPAPSDVAADTPDQLVFLCASGPQGRELRRVRVPIATSLSGAVFLSGRATIASPPATGTAFASRTDKVTDFKTNEVLSVCLRYKGERVGVAQFVNKREGRRFDSADIDRAVALCTTLALRVGDFVSDPRRVIELGHAPRTNRFAVTTMFVDLTNYGQLFDQLDGSVITDLLNEYFQDVCSIALRQGAMIEQLTGDGVFLIFNLDQRQAEHNRAAMAAAVEMRTAFRALRERWRALGYAGTDGLFIRFGIATGPVTRAEIGHAQARRVTVLGPVVNHAAHLCAAAPRDRDVICVAEGMDGAEIGRCGAERALRRNERGSYVELLG